VKFLEGLGFGTRNGAVDFSRGAYPDLGFFILTSMCMAVFVCIHKMAPIALGM